MGRLKPFLDHAIIVNYAEIFKILLSTLRRLVHFCNVLDIISRQMQIEIREIIIFMLAWSETSARRTIQFCIKLHRKHDPT